MEQKSIPITTDYIKLDSLLKFAGLIVTGGAARERVQAGDVLVNGQPCSQRGKKLYPGDTAQLDGVLITVSKP